MRVQFAHTAFSYVDSVGPGIKTANTVLTPLAPIKSSAVNPMHNNGVAPATRYARPPPATLISALARSTHLTRG